MPRELLSEIETPQNECRFACDAPGCRYSTEHQGTFNRHKLTHSTAEKPFKCDYPECNYSAVHRSALNVHKRSHTGEKTYKCDQCDFIARRQDHLNIHKRKHTGEKPYKCFECSYTATRRDNVRSHMVRMHKINENKANKISENES